ncbi:hypothetical protein Fcan01_01383 [Folsomia candida]|uniref:Uncharacterized protein n=1 Tax=Folsomia candida TaxID=158441 RepID=A0A226EXK6_FOLCA|nr:hypothetical protein Fcan01_01383 [Folsomia candida]
MLKSEKVVIFCVLLLGFSLRADAAISWKALIKKGMEVLFTGAVVAGVDATLEANKPDGKQLVVYPAPFQPQPQPNHDERGLGLTLFITGSFITCIGIIGLMCSFLFKCIKCKQVRDNNPINIELGNMA